MMFYTAVGPKEFLTLIRFSKFVICKSFHAVIFSMFFSRPFYAVDGMNDNRVANLLSKHSIASEAFCMNQVTFALQNIKIRLWQALKIWKGRTL